MTDYRSLAGKTVDGYYYLLPTDVIQKGDEWLYGNTWHATLCEGETPNWENVNVPCGSMKYVIYRRPVATRQPAPPCSRCEELEGMIDRLVSALLSNRLDEGQSAIHEMTNDYIDRARVKIGGE